MTAACEPLTALGAATVAAARAAGQRRALLLTGEAAWAREAAQCLLAGAGLSAPLWIGDSASGNGTTLPAIEARTLLGQELDAVVYDAFAGFDPDAFGAASGAVRGGGLLILLAPPLAEWPDYPDPQRARIAVALYPPETVTGRYLHRLAAVLAADPDLLRIEQGRLLLPAPPLPAPPPPAEAGDDECRTADQRRAVEALERVVRGQRRRPTVLVSDRGRGKSAALGIAAARLLRAGTRTILVTAPRLDAVAPLFERAAARLPGAHHTRGALHWEGAVVRFIAPDALIQGRPEAELVLVDEAAAIPAPLLERMLAAYGRIAFATTVHGYEGTGRGFAVRFRKVLDSRTRGWREVRLEAPIRFAAGDPLERLTFAALLLDAAPAPDAAVAEAAPETCTLERPDRDALAADDATLGELFGLLVLAHYRTSPLDLRHLLDGPNLAVRLLRWRGHVVATALVAREGGFDAATAAAIWRGERRPPGHMIPEALGTHLGLAAAPGRIGWRVVRIAVHPAVQGRGLGRKLLNALSEEAAAEGLDYIGASFGATPDLLAFWRGAGFAPVYLGVRRGTASGTHAVIMLCPLSDAGEAIAEAARERFADHLPELLADPLRTLEPELAADLLCGQASAPELAPRDWDDLLAFAFARRNYDAAQVALRRLALRALATGNPPEAADRTLLVLRTLQHRDWSECAALTGLAGRDAITARLRAIAGELVLRYGDETVQAAARRLRGQD